MQPEIAINHLAVIVCVIASMPVGYLWFGPLFGTAWARHMGMEDMEPPGGGAMAKSLGLNALGSLLIAFVLAHSIQVWMPSTWGVGENAAPHVYGFHGAIWTWLGFFFPLQIGRVAWEGRRWGLVVINSSFDLVRLLMFGMILAYWQ